MEIKLSGYLERTSCIGKEQVVLVVGAASSRDHLISRLEAAPTEGILW
jgi:hypothetical protein